MIISSIAGGMGNQMFQVAAGLRLARRHGTVLKLDLSGYKSGRDIRPPGLGDFKRLFRLYELSVDVIPATPIELIRLGDPYSVTTPIARIVRRIRRVRPAFLWPRSHVRERGYRFQPDVLNLPDNIYLQGFWQSWKYFDDISDLVRRAFAPRDPAVVSYAAQFLDRLRERGEPVVSVHVRRGDLARAHEELENPGLVYGAPVGLDYLYAGMKRFGPKAQYLIFSDTPADIQWCRMNIQPLWLSADRRHFSEGHSDVQDMAIMSACDHNIIANSTFSWWAAWLNSRPGRRVIAPRQWSHAGPTETMVADDLIPPQWEFIDASELADTD